MGKEDVACYRLYAANCVELAERILDAGRRAFLLRMGQRWARLADQVEKADAASGAAINTATVNPAGDVQAPRLEDRAAEGSLNPQNNIQNDVPGDPIPTDRGNRTDSDAGVSRGG